MSRNYTTLSCGCQVTCDEGGGLLPCVDKETCVLETYLYEHQYCDFCNECVICYNHWDCMNLAEEMNKNE